MYSHTRLEIVENANV